MKIWVDGDACPSVIKDIIFKAAERTCLNVVLVANRKVTIPKSTHIKFQIVPPGLDGADNEIAKNVEPGDLVVTSDIPLAARIVEQGALGLNPRGEVYTTETII